MLHGRNLIVQTASDELLAAKSCEIETKADMNEVSSTSLSNFKKFMAGRKEWSVSTNHLLSSAYDIRKVLNVGSTVTLRMFAVDPSKVYLFKETIAAVPVEDHDTSLVSPDHIYFHITEKYFVAEIGGTFYRYWADPNNAYHTPTAGNIYRTLDGTSFYAWAGSGNALGPCAPRLQGGAIVKQCRISAQVGALAKGSFVFQGSGDLTWVTSNT